MQGGHAITVQTITTTQEERQAIYERLLQRQQVRRASMLPLIDIATQYRRQLRLLEAKKYEEHLKPYLDHAFSTIEGHPGIAGRILQTVRAYRAAKAALWADTGLQDPRGQEPDFAALADELLPQMLK